MLKPPKWRRHLAIKVDPLRILRSTGAVCDSHRDAVVVDTLVHQRRRGNGGRPRTPCRSSKPETNAPPPDDVFSAFVRLLFDGIRPLHKTMASLLSRQLPRALSRTVPGYFKSPRPLNTVRMATTRIATIDASINPTSPNGGLTLTPTTEHPP